MKKLLFILAAVVVTGGVIYYISKKSSKPTGYYIDPAFSEYISSYTAGALSSGSAVRVILSHDLADSTMVGNEASTKFFDFSPSLQGKTFWIDNRTLEFRPDQRMPSGQVFEVKFLLSRLMKVPDNLSEFVYSFQVMQQNYELSVTNIKPYVKTELERQRMEGTLFTADFAENEMVEQTITADQNGNMLKVSWAHGGDGKQHSFVVEEVKRMDAASKVKLAVNGKPIGVGRNDETEVEVPALGDFKLLSARVVQNPSQFVVLQFSDPLRERQQLAGLITIGEDRGMTLDFEIHDNEISVYPPVRQTGMKTITIEAGIRNIKDYKMIRASSSDVLFEQLKPQVKFTSQGNILPGSNGLVLPFEAVNLRAVDVTIQQIFESNILQFLQVNRLEGLSELRRVGRKVVSKTISLDNSGVTDLGKWNRFTLDLEKIINTAPGNIYQVRIKFKKAYSVYACDQGGDDTNELVTEETSWDEDEDRGNYYEDDYYYTPGYEWEERENPCHVSYYTSDKIIRKNIIASDLGLIAKAGNDGGILVIVNDIKTTMPLNGVEVEFYDFQQQLLMSQNTGSDGKTFFQGKEQPFFVVAKNGSQRGYLRLDDGESLSLSGFDVSGERINEGLKGFLYGERGVWRPGDSLFLSFILEDKSKTLPEAHPVVFELQNPQGIVATRLVMASSENGFYKFATSTSADAPTGNWQATVKVGGTSFSQTVKIETVKPNRLKINLDFGTTRLLSPDLTGNLSVKWLHGAPGRNLKAEFDVSLVEAGTTFKNYEDFRFVDVSRVFYSETVPVFAGSTDGDGRATFSTTITASSLLPGFMTAVFRGKVYEESGAFSIDRFTLPYSPFPAYLGYRFPNAEKYSGMLYTDTTQTAEIVAVDGDGNLISRNGVSVSLYKLDRYWWWDNGDYSIANYVESRSSSLVKSSVINLPSGKASWAFNVSSADWGTYYIRICDANGHCTGSTFYMDQPGYYGRYSREEKGGATKLAFTTDKKGYQVGESVTLTIPGSDGGRALISLESGSKVISTDWFETKKGENSYSFRATEEMTPNIFVHVSLLQPHAQTVNSLPIRLYGVMPVGIEDPQTHLEPVIAMPDVLEPGSEVTIKISEKSKRKMTFTLAMVDEGLLDITRFQTPDPWSRFYAREALGVKTWDLYDRVIGAYGSHIERLLAIGGGDEMKAKDSDPRANRFKAVVQFFGPITIESGDTEELKFTMPQYIGSVKTMVVAGFEGAYGKAEQVTPVRKPLMVLATLPRVLGPEEKVILPVTLFTQDKKIRNVKVEVKVSGPLTIAEASQNITMPESGDFTADFNLDVKGEIGIGKVQVIATGGGLTATDEIEIEIRNPNPPVTQVVDKLMEAGTTWEASVNPVGIAGTNSASLEVSVIPPINLGYRLRYLMEFPHGCIEQTTSGAFPQLFLDVVRSLNDAEKARIKKNVTAAIERLKLFVTADGGFAYWPGGSDSDSWGSTYAGHFLMEAESKGYFVPADMIRRWKKYQKNKASEWRKTSDYEYWDYIQAYRLYTLAVSGSPDLASMNRLRETKALTLQASWMLASAYAKAGQKEVASKMISGLTLTIRKYQEMYYTYGSDLRDKAMILETLSLLNEKTKGFELLKDISVSLSDQGYWMSTQTTAFCLKAIGAFIGAEKRGAIKFSYSHAGKSVNASTDLPLAQVSLPVAGIQKSPLKITNESQGSLFVRIVVTGTPARGQEMEESKNLAIAASYYDSKGNPVEPQRLEQGTEFIAVINVRNPGLRGEYRNMALTQIFPSGWEINNLRVTGDENTFETDRGDYQDIRDDRVYTYFWLGPGQARTFRVQLTATYGGSFYMPAVSCEAMYDNSVYARTKGQVAEVVKVLTP